MNRMLQTLLIPALCVAAISGASANTLLYWDTNGATPGAGATPTGNWDGVTANWNSDPTGGAGGSLTAITSTSTDLIFSAGSDYSSSYTVTVSGTQYAGSISLFNDLGYSGDNPPKFSTPGVTISGGTIELGANGLVSEFGVQPSSITGTVITTGAQQWSLNGFDSNGTSEPTGLVIDNLVLNGNLTLTGGLQDEDAGGDFGYLPNLYYNDLGAAQIGNSSDLGPNVPFYNAVTDNGGGYGFIANLAPTGVISFGQPQSSGYSGGITLNSGIISFGLTQNGGSNADYKGNIFGTGGITFNGGTLSLDAENNNRSILPTDAITVGPGGGVITASGGNGFADILGNISNSGTGAPGNLTLIPAATNTGATTVLAIGGTNTAFTGGFTVGTLGEGGVRFDSLAALGQAPAGSSDGNQITILPGAVLGLFTSATTLTASNYAQLQDQLSSTTSREAILALDNLNSINLSGTGGLGLNLRLGILSGQPGTGGNNAGPDSVTFSGSIVPYATTYRFAAVGGSVYDTLTLNGVDQLNGTNSLDISSAADTPGSIYLDSGVIFIDQTQDYTGATYLHGITGNALISSNGSEGQIPAYTGVSRPILVVQNANLAGSGVGSMGTFTVDRNAQFYLVGASGSASGIGTLAIEGGGEVFDGDSNLSGYLGANTGNNTNVANRINSGATLALGGVDGGGTFSLAYGASGTTSQTFASIAVGPGSNTITFNNSAAGVANVISAASAFTRTTAGGILNVPAYSSNGGVILSGASGGGSSTGGTSINGYTFIGTTYAGVDANGDLRAYTPDTSNIGASGAFQTSSLVQLNFGNTLTTAEIVGSTSGAGIDVQGNVLTLSLGGLAVNDTSGSAVVEDSVGGGGITSSYEPDGVTPELIIGGGNGFALSAQIVQYNGVNVTLTDDGAGAVGSSSGVKLQNAANQIGNVFVDGGDLRIDAGGALGQNGVTRTVSLLGGGIIFNQPAYTYDANTSWYIGPSGGYMNATTAVNSGGTGIGEVKLSGSMVLDGFLNFGAFSTANGGTIELAGNLSGPGAIGFGSRSGNNNNNTVLILSGTNTAWSGGFSSYLGGIYSGNGRAAIEIASSASAGTGPFNDSFANTGAKQNFQVYLDTSATANSNYTNNFVINNYTPISTWSLGPGDGATGGTIATISGNITGNSQLILQGYATGTNAISETVLSGTVSATGLPYDPWNNQVLMNFSYGNTSNAFVVGAGGIDLGVTNYLAGGGVGVGVLAPGNSTTVANGALGFVRFSGSNSLVPGATGAGFVAAIHTAGDTSAAGEFGYLLTGGTSSQTFQLPQGKSFIIGSLGVAGATPVGGVFGTAHDNDNPALTYTATLLGSTKAGAGETLPGVAGGDIDIESTSGTDAQTLSLLARASNDVLVLGNSTNPVVFTPTSGDSGSSTTGAVTAVQERTGLTTINMIGAGVVNFKNVAFTNTDGSSAASNFAFNVNAGTLLVSGSIGGNTTVNSGGTLGGGGDSSGAITVATGGTLYPGATTTGARSLTLQNTVTFSAGSTFEVNLNDSHGHSDLLAITGALSIGAGDTLTLNILNALTAGSYEIATYTGGETGTFLTVQNLPSNYQVEYNAGDIELDAVPEPATWAATLTGLGLLLLAQRLRRKASR